MKPVIIDIREQDEYKTEHVENSINIPLSNFSYHAPGILSQVKDRKVVLMCLSGKRASLAKIEALKLGIDFSEGLEIFLGGINEWKASGKPTVQLKKGHLPLIRQTHLGAGLTAMTGVILGYTVNPIFFALAGFVGLGLTVAGVTGFCGMTELLAKAPWNKEVPEINKELCQATKGDGSCQQA